MYVLVYVGKRFIFSVAFFVCCKNAKHLPGFSSSNMRMCCNSVSNVTVNKTSCLLTADGSEDFFLLFRWKKKRNSHEANNASIEKAISRRLDNNH